MTNDFNNESKIEISQFQDNRLKEFIYSTNNSILSKIDKASNKLGELITINRGVNIGGCFDSFLYQERVSKEYYKYISGTKNVKKYFYEWNLNDGYCKLDLQLESQLRKKGKTLVLGDITRFDKDKIFIPESSQTVTAVFSEEDVCSAYGIMVGTLNDVDISLHFVTGVLNSKTINFYCIGREILRKGNKATPHIGVKGLNSIPIMRNQNIETEISRISKMIHSKKKDNKETLSEENQIDQLVYQLYELTEEEIKIIEGE